MDKNEQETKGRKRNITNGEQRVAENTQTSQPTMRQLYFCPHCGRIYTRAGVVPAHNYTEPCSLAGTPSTVCPGVGSQRVTEVVRNSDGTIDHSRYAGAVREDFSKSNPDLHLMRSIMSKNEHEKGSKEYTLHSAGINYPTQAIPLYEVENGECFVYERKCFRKIREITDGKALEHIEVLELYYELCGRWTQSHATPEQFNPYAVVSTVDPIIVMIGTKSKER